MFNPNTTPFVVSWHIATGERLTRYREIVRDFATQEEALAAAAAPFLGPNIISVVVKHFQATGLTGWPQSHKLSIIARRKNGKPMRTA